MKRMLIVAAVLAMPASAHAQTYVTDGGNVACLSYEDLVQAVRDANANDKQALAQMVSGPCETTVGGKVVTIEDTRPFDAGAGRTGVAVWIRFQGTNLHVWVQRAAIR